MKVHQLFVHFSPEQYRLLIQEHKDEVKIKTFLDVHVKDAINKECERIKAEQLNQTLEQPEKL